MVLYLFDVNDENTELFICLCWFVVLVTFSKYTLRHRKFYNILLVYNFSTFDTDVVM